MTVTLTNNDKVNMTTDEAIEALRAVKNYVGRNYKSAIRDAWMDGNYASRGLYQWSSQLQNIRNIYGPSWLVKVRV